MEKQTKPDGSTGSGLFGKAAKVGWILGFLFIGIELLRLAGFYIVNPGEVGVKITLGSISREPLEPGFGFKIPIITEVRKVNTRQTTEEVTSTCFSSDLQQVTLKVRVLYRIPEKSAISMIEDYNGDPFLSLIVPRVQEAVKEVTALRSAASIAKTREEIKTLSLKSAQEKIGELLEITDLVIEDVSLSKDLEAAIEAKMVQQQEAEKALFKQQQAKTDADTAIIKAKAEAEAIRIQGEALQKTPKLVELRMVEKWDGKAPMVLGSGGSGMILPWSAPELAR